MDKPSRPLRFAVVGGGWRAETFVRIAERAPEWFDCVGVVVRNPEKAEAFAKKTGTKTLGDMEPLFDLGLDFAVSSVSWTSNPDVVKTLAERGLSVLSETPPAQDRKAMEEMMDLCALGAKVQVAEQVALRPHYQAVKAAITQGLIGEVHQVQVSVSHGYHGVSLLEELLGTVGSSPNIRATHTPDPVTKGPGRDGGPFVEEQTIGKQLIAWLKYSDSKFGVFDFVGTQYFSHIRNSRLLVRGNMGEIDIEGARWLTSFDTPIEARFCRRETGRGDNLAPYSLEGITLADKWLYRNPFVGASLQDDEIAMATMMLASGTSQTIYPLARAMHDHALSIALNEAAASGGSSNYEPGAWD